MCRTGQVEIDNNLVENVIRPIALGRKNYLFADPTKAHSPPRYIHY
ncbi:MAG: transposase [Saprospiraceae bacterium]|nr:transposase [Candidatus Vicinibacter affinis]